MAVSACRTAAAADELAGASAVAFSWAPAFTPTNRAASCCSSMHVATLGLLCGSDTFNPTVAFCAKGSYGWITRPGTRDGRSLPQYVQRLMTAAYSELAFCHDH